VIGAIGRIEHATRQRTLLTPTLPENTQPKEQGKNITRDENAKDYCNHDQEGYVE
jgi:hypothetical protein